jgi:uncharacterized protein with von Willebrand factor type A (vWA) domain
MTAAEAIVQRVVRFGRALRQEGAEVGPGRVRDALVALESVGVESRESAYWALRCTLISRAEHVAPFDAAFESFWGDAPEPDVPEQPGAGAREEPGEVSMDLPDEEGGIGQGEGDEGEEAIEQGAAWSASERLRQLDFASYTQEELRDARPLVERIARAAPRRRSRRLEPAHDGRTLDKRLTMRAAMRTDGYPIERAWRRRRVVRRRLVFLVDVSGSMEPYARATLMFLQAAVGPGRKVEAFTFGTRLTRVTPQLVHGDPDAALRAAAEVVPDWAGGTRIGDNLRAFNERWGSGVARGAAVVVVSDGWERGDPRLLEKEIERIGRAAHTLVWVNPLAGEPGYEPLVQGMAAALPHIDVFLPGHNLASFETLAEVLESLPRG